MAGLVERHSIKITILSPLHIGTGERVNDKSRWEAGGRLWIVDEDVLLQKVAASPTMMSRFETFCLDPRQRLCDFLDQARVQPEAVALYGVPRLGGPATRDYLPFIKVPRRPPQPYIPGSSLKGAVRSAFLRAAVIGDEKLRTRAAEWVGKTAERHNPRRADDTLDQRFFSTQPSDRHWQNYDWMRLFQFTDTAPLATDALAVTEVRVLSVRGGKSSGYTLVEKEIAPNRPMALHPEVLLPGVKMTSQIVLLQNLLQSPADGELHFLSQRSTTAYLLRQCNRVAKEQIEQELTFAQKVGWAEGSRFYAGLGRRLIELTGNACLLRLGWGAGYDDKTITDLLDDETFEKVREAYNRQMPVGYPARNPSNAPLSKAFSPKSRKVALNDKGRWLPMGWIMVELSAN